MDWMLLLRIGLYFAFPALMVWLVALLLEGLL